MQSTALFYRKSEAQGASGFGMLIALYETLAGDLRRAADAERNTNLEKRCQEVNHALVVIGFLEDSIERASGGDLAQQLLGLYSSLRRKLIEAQAKRSAEMLEQQMHRVISVRARWQAMEASTAGTENTLADMFVQNNQKASTAFAESPSMSWSA